MKNQNRYPHLFSPITIKGVEFKNRLEVSPMVPCMATPDGFVTQELVDFTRSFAKSGAAIVTVGDSAINWEHAMDHEGQINVGDDNVKMGLNHLAEEVHRYGANISIELNHGGRFSNSGNLALKGLKPVSSTPIPAEIDEFFASLQGRTPEPIEEMDEYLIRKTVQDYASAAKRCQDSGFKMIMLHGAHGMLMGQFLSPYINKRTDRYGGALKNRARFCIEIIDSIRRLCGENFIIEYRISAEELVEGGMSLNEVIEFVHMIKNKIDILHVSAGMLPNPFTIQYMIQPLYIPYMRNVHYAEKIKEAVGDSVKVVAVGSIMTLENAEEILARGKVDFVALARPFVADPDFVKKSLHGRLEDVRPCVRCNTCCGRSAFFQKCRCAVNPTNGKEGEFPDGKVTPARTSKKVVIIGGGVAGMQAALTAVERGHDVALYEKSNVLGGTLIPASALEFKQDLRNYLNWMVAQTEKCGAQIVKNTEVTADMLNAEEIDELIIAVGATPIIPKVKGIDNANVHLAIDADEGKIKVGNKIIIVGAGLTGIESAISLAKNGKEVTVIDMVGMDGILKGASLINRFSLMSQIEQYGIKVIPHTKLEEVTETGIKGINTNLQWVNLEADTVLLAMGMKSRRDKVEELRHLLPETDIHIIGDCFEPSNIFSATHAGFDVASEL